jgi:hypothetical protein
MVISCFHSICWRMKLDFMSANTSPKLELLLVLDQSQPWSSVGHARQHKCRHMFRLTKYINVVIPCCPYSPHRALVDFFTFPWAIERWNLSSVSLLLRSFLKLIGENMIAMILRFLNIRHSCTLFGMWFLTSAQQLFLLILPSIGSICGAHG